MKECFAKCNELLSICVILRIGLTDGVLGCIRFKRMDLSPSRC